MSKRHNKITKTITKFKMKTENLKIKSNSKYTKILKLACTVPLENKAVVRSRVMCSVIAGLTEG